MKGFIQTVVGVTLMAASVAAAPSRTFGFWHVITILYMIMGFVVAVIGVLKINYKGGDIMDKCVVCKGNVDKGLVREEFAEILNQADSLGVDSLTENQQVVYEWSCCSIECYEQLD